MQNLFFYQLEYEKKNPYGFSPPAHAVHPSDPGLIHLADHPERKGGGAEQREGQAVPCNRPDRPDPVKYYLQY